MRTAQISFQNKKVWIIGGGNQGILRGKQFIEEGAQVIFVAPSINKELQEILVGGVSCIESVYQKELITDGFLVFACTDNRELNHQIVMDANEKGMLSASVHKDSEASYHPLRFRDYPNLHVAMSTNGAFPSYLDVLLEEIEQNYHQVHHEKLEELRVWRGEILAQGLDKEERKAILKSWKNSENYQ